MAVLTRNDFSNLTGELQSIFKEQAENKIAESTGLKIFDVMDTELYQHTHQILHGLAGITRVADGADLPSISSQQGDQITYTQTRYGAIVSVTKENRIFWREQNGRVMQQVISITDEAFDKIDQSLADVLLNGWSTSYADVYGDTVASTGPDGLALFSTAHTNNVSSATFDNIVSDGTNTNPVLSRAAIVNERATALKYSDPNGLIRPIKLDTLVVGPDLEDTARRIVESNLLPGSGNNDLNPSLVRSMNIVVWDRLGSNSAGTDTSAYWFMMDSKKAKETLKCLFKEKPSLDAPEVQYANKNWDYSLDYIYSIGRGFPAYVRGSKGDNS